MALIKNQISVYLLFAHTVTLSKQNLQVEYRASVIMDLLYIDGEIKYE